MSNKTILTNDWKIVYQNRKLIKLVDSMQKVSTKIDQRVQEVNSDIITTRKDPIVKEYWDELCKLHVKALLICHREPNQDPNLINFVTKPQACINFLHLSEEEVCCRRQLSHLQKDS